MSTDNHNRTHLEELSDEQLEQAQGGAALWNGKDKFPQKISDRSSVKSADAIKVRAGGAVKGGGSNAI